ncbi:hypothetical protein AB0K88_32790 [Streptomyces werraensis]|uniref:hypothetical protein n=1 Tax=Streptomyces werraensis TaxID=68284 RepID=UPI0034229611
MTSTPPPPSMDFLRAELDQEVSLQEKRAESLATRGQILLIFVGVLVSVVRNIDDASVVQQCSMWVAATAGVLIIVSLFVSAGSTLDVGALWNVYSVKPEDESKLAVFATRLALLQNNRGRLRNQHVLHVIALVMLAASLGLLISGTV